MTPQPIISVPHESAPHQRTFMQWPGQTYATRSSRDAVASIIAKIANTIIGFEDVVMLVPPRRIDHAKRHLNTKVQLWPVATDDVWCRDSGPTFGFTSEGNPAVIDFAFNGWGNRQQHENDRLIARRVAAQLGVPIVASTLIGEAGGFDVDGDGTIIVHESSWINVNRNRFRKPTIERLLCAALGGSKVIWAPGLKGRDVTDLHIDSVARFIKPGLVLVQLPDRASRDVFSRAAFATYDILKRSRDAKGRPIDVVVVDEPRRVRSSLKSFVASYANFYAINGAILIPEYGDARADDAARCLLAALFPTRKVISITVDTLAELGGGIHCVTQPQPQVG